MSARLKENNLNIRDEAVSSWMVVDQAMINGFADVTNDHNFIHVDPERAAQSPMGGTIAHGLLTLSMLPFLANEAMPASGDVKMEVNYGYDKIRFLTPLHSGQRIRGRFTILDFTEIRSNEWRKKLSVTIEIENQPKPALIAEWITLLYT